MEDFLPRSLLVQIMQEGKIPITQYYRRQLYLPETNEEVSKILKICNEA